MCLFCPFCYVVESNKTAQPTHRNTIKGSDYLENNCAEEPNKLCEFKRLSGRILKTVDSVYQDVSNVDECRELCLNSPYR